MTLECWTVNTTTAYRWGGPRVGFNLMLRPSTVGFDAVQCGPDGASSLIGRDRGLAATLWPAATGQSGRQGQAGTMKKMLDRG